MPDFNTTLFTTERIYMVDFGRAKTGPPHRRFPDVDNAGYTDDAHGGEHGPIVSAMAGQSRVNVRFSRTEISTAAKLFAVSSNTAAVEVTAPRAGSPLTSSRNQNIQFRAVAAGRAEIQIRYNWADGPVVGRLYVQVYDRIQVPMRVHLLTVNGRGQRPVFFSRRCANRAERVARIRQFVNSANETWTPHGIVFTILDTVDTAWGAAEVPSLSQLPTLFEMVFAGAMSPNRSAVAVNVYIMPGVSPLNPMTGMGVSPDSARSVGAVFPAVPPPPPGTQHFGSGLFLDSTSPATPQTIAHEMGHYMSLCGLPNQGHSTGDLDIPAGTHTRDDLVSRRRLMYPIVGLFNGAPSNWRNDTGYGRENAGSFITYRTLPAAQDFTFNESQRARNATAAPGFFAP